MRCPRARHAPAAAPWASSVLALVLAAGASPLLAGSFVFTSDARLDAVTHPSNYDPAVGGVVTVRVCIDPAAANAAAMEIPVRNIATVINALSAKTPNLIFGGANDIPPGAVDFESLTLHEFGHCIGLGHPNLGVQTGVSGADTDFTQARDGADDAFSFNDGADDVIGSSDDLRGDDVNLHWFVKGVNNPFLMPPAPLDQTNYSRQVGDLPAGHSFPANAGRDVGTLLGFADTEAVMQQGQGFDEDQRALQADDVATLRFAMTGLDETAGTADDYTINMVYVGMTTACDIVVKSETTGFGVCRIGGQFTDPTLANTNHLTISSAEFAYNSTFTWYFNDKLIGCTAAFNDRAVSGMDTGTVAYTACNSITFTNYMSTGTVTATAPIINIGNESSIGGTFTATTATP